MLGVVQFIILALCVLSVTGAAIGAAIGAPLGCLREDDPCSVVNNATECCAGLVCYESTACIRVVVAGLTGLRN